MTRIIRDFVNDTRDNARRAMRFAEWLTFERFAADEKTVYAVARAVEIIGEAAKRVPAEVRALAPEIPWRDITAMRDRLVHDYINVRLNLLWQTVTQELGPFVERLDRLDAQLQEQNPFPPRVGVVRPMSSWGRPGADRPLPIEGKTGKSVHKSLRRKGLIRLAHPLIVGKSGQDGLNPCRVAT